MKHKSTERSRLTRDQIDAYRTGSNRTRRAIEGSVSDPFEQDALDGWEASGLTTSSAMGRMDKRFRLSSSTPYLLGSILAVAAIISAVFFLAPHESSKQHRKQVQLSVEHSDAVITPSIDTMTELPESKQIHIDAIRTTQQEIKSQPETTPITDVAEIPPVVLEPLKPGPIVSEQKVSTQRNAKEIYLHDLKLIDYSQYRNNPEIKIEQIVLLGTTANYETSSEMEMDADPTIRIVPIPYVDYLDKTMSYVNKGKWKQSLQRLQLILETYPDDVNGHFYAGLCSYNLQQYEAAKQHFAMCLKLPYNNFNEEASWYLAQSLLANGEKPSAKELLIVIRDQRGYYSKQAESLLKGIK